MRERTIHAVSACSSLSGATRVRLTQWFSHLGVNAIEHSYAGLGTNRPYVLGKHLGTAVRAEMMLRRLDVRGSTVVLSREATPFGSGSVEARLLSDADHSVFDFDDAIFLQSSPLRRLVADTKFQKSVRAADVVIAGNTFLAEQALLSNPNTTVIPSCVEPNEYTQKESWDIPEIATMVWIGSPGTERYLVGVMGALRRIHAQTGARLKLISGRNHNPELGGIAEFTDRVEWTPDAFERHLSGADIALAPLDDTPWSRGKCAYKLLQYAAAGVPMVGSPVGANALALDRFDGLSATSEDDWVDAVLALLNEPAARRRSRSLRGRAAVEKHYSFAAWAPTWARLVGLGGDSAQ